MSENRMIGIFGMTPISILAHTTGNELKAYIALASFQGNSETSWPSLEQIAKRASLSVQATSEAITGLVKNKLATRKRNYGKTNTYKVLIPTKEAEDSYPENPDNQGKADNPEKSDVDHREKSGDGYPEKSDDIGKEHIKTTKEKNIEIQPTYNIEEQPYKKVQAVINKFLLENNRGKCREDGYNLQIIVDNCMSDNIEEEVLDMCIRFKNHPWWWEKYSPQPKRLVQAWDQLLAIEIPDWKRLGYGSEYEYNIKHKTQPSHHTTIQEIAEVQTVKVEPERVESFLDELEEMKK